jgi:CHAT domain-containing protein
MASDFDILHLAVHGRGDVQNDFAASLFFTNPRSDKDDGELHAYELYGLKFKALMAVLSSCESGLGKGYKGEGMISMASAFAFSGCQNTLMSLWKVNDQASVKLMDNFYGYFLEGETIDVALRQSKLTYLADADELTAHPRIWAPLVVYGNLEGIQKDDRSGAFMIAGVLAIVTIVLLSLRRFKRQHSVSTS